MKSLYVHFPFCETKCHYCDFYSLGRERTQAGDADKYEAALKREATRQASLLAPELDTIFLGGGTPSMTPADSMARALEPIWAHTRVTPKTEWTMEANPSSVDSKTLKSYRALGVNRISMGVQAINDELLKKLGRVHSRDKALESLKAIFEAGFTNVSTDLLCGVPGQTLDDLSEALETLTSFPITHLSCYLLTLPPHHRMYRELPDEDTQLAHLLFIHKWMTAHGFEHYEISNFAKPGHEARHNLNYWQGVSYLGLGPSAHSYNAKSRTRWKNVSSIHKYASLLEAGDSAIDSTETLNPEQLEIEKWMLALRLEQGFPVEWLSKPSQWARAKAFEQEGLLEDHPFQPLRKRLTPKGFALSDRIISAFI